MLILRFVSFLKLVVHILNVHLLPKVEFLVLKIFRSEYSLKYPPIFIVGAPRCGSTLAVQAITEALDVGYFSNKHCKWFGAPTLVQKLFDPSAKREVSDFCSEHGMTRGQHSPAECGEWWYRFFPRNPTYTTLDSVVPQNMYAFRRAICSLTSSFDKPIVFKNLNASLRIQAIAHYIPESLFVVIHRDELDNGHSLLEARFDSYGDYGPWFSIKPPAFDDLRLLPPHEQVIEQIRNIYETIDADLKQAKTNDTQRLDFTYEEFCARPNFIVDKVSLFLKENGCHVERRGVALPGSFSRRQTVRIEERLYESLRQYASNEAQSP